MHAGRSSAELQAVIRAIAAVDDRLGLGTDTGIPWSVPADVEHFRRATEGTDVVMGYATYSEYPAPMAGRTNFVARSRPGALRPGFVVVVDLSSFLAGRGADDLWVIGGAAVFRSTLAQTEELLLTRIRGDFGCTKFFPPFEPQFELVQDAPTGPSGQVPGFSFQRWRRRH